MNSPLPDQWVYGIDIDGDVAWLATGQGLARFDMTSDEWTIFDRSAGLPASEPRAVRVDARGDVWVALTTAAPGEQGGVARYDGESWTMVTGASGLPWASDHIISLMIDSRDRIWVTNGHESGAAVYEDGDWMLHEPPNPPWKLRSPMEDAAGGLWFATDFGAWRLLDGVWTYHQGAFDVRSIRRGPGGSVWLGTSSGEVFSYDGAGWTLVVDVDDRVRSISFDPSGRPLIVTPFYSYWLDGGAVTGAYNGYNTGMTDYDVSHIHVDDRGHYWFSSSFGGLCEFDGTVWNGFNAFNQGSQPWPFNRAAVTGADSDAGGNLWISTGEGLGRWNGDTWTVYDRSTSGIFDDDLTCVAVDSRGWIWAGGDATGINWFDGATWHHAGAGTLPSGEIRNVVADDAGNVYICDKVGLAIFDGAEWRQHSPPGFPVHDVAVDDQGDLWVATGEGLAHWDGARWAVHDETNSGVPADWVSSVAIGHDGLIWVGGFNVFIWPYYGGVASFDGATWTRYMAGSSGISHVQVEDVAVDRNGDILVSALTEGVDIIRVGDHCRADLDGDGELTFFDFLVFQNLFAAGDPQADFDGDGSLDFFDFLAFQNEFTAGCA